MKATHRMWMYRNGEAKVFEEGEAIPQGWKDTPAKDDEAPKRRGRPPKEVTPNAV